MTDGSRSRVGHIFAFLPATMLGLATVQMASNGSPWMAFVMGVFTMASQLLTAVIYPFTPEVKSVLAKELFSYD